MGNKSTHQKFDKVQRSENRPDTKDSLEGLSIEECKEIDRAELLKEAKEV